MAAKSKNNGLSGQDIPHSRESGSMLPWSPPGASAYTEHFNTTSLWQPYGDTKRNWCIPVHLGGGEPYFEAEIIFGAFSEDMNEEN